LSKSEKQNEKQISRKVAKPLGETKTRILIVCLSLRLGGFARDAFLGFEVRRGRDRKKAETIKGRSVSPAF
jgi:hypothetical protein